MCVCVCRGEALDNTGSGGHVLWVTQGAKDIGLFVWDTQLQETQAVANPGLSG